MSWSFRVGRLFGIDLYIHFTFLLLLGFIVVSQYGASQSWAVAGFETLFILLVFAIVVMHELGHALAARQFGVRTRDITLLPIGGVARLERIPQNPLHEFVIAIAGPAVNVVLAILCLAWLIIAHQLPIEPLRDFSTAGLVQRLFAINVALVLFNMIPAFPMDGGRVLRAILAMGMDYVRATHIAALVGQTLALLLGLYGLGMFGNVLGLQPSPILVLIALFVWMGASQEANFVAARASLAGVSVRRAMISHFQIVGPEDTLGAVAHHVLEGFQHDFPVVEDKRVVGIITRSDLLKALAELGREGHVADVMQREFVAVHPDEPLTEAFQMLQECECHSLPVIKNGELVGLLTAENVGEFVMIDSAVKQQSHRPQLPLATPSRAT